MQWTALWSVQQSKSRITPRLKHYQNNCLA
uniref:Uncharacterized protein n=1 Tax=Anguilla anguilla TaxID=7936 RepID=A0A0E9Q7D0_ANGAN